MTIIIGLGNPGKKFETTRHNVGFMAIDEFAKKNNFPDFSLNKKANTLVSEKNNVFLAKPQTFMNDSGFAVKEIIKNTNTDNIIVVHDDIDLPIGSIKIVKERGSAGHKGVESIIQAIGNNGLIRIRIGIQPQKDTKALKIVLKKFSKEETASINDTLTKACSALDLLVEKGLDVAMNEYNR